MNDTHTTVGMPFKGRRLLIVGVFTLVAIGVVSVTAATDAVACSCAMGTDAQSYDNADAVFTGRLVGESESDGDHSGSDLKRYEFAVDEVYKGVVYTHQTVLSSWSGSSCGLELDGPGPFVVFATKGTGYPSDPSSKFLSSTLCSGNRPVADGGSLPATIAVGSAPLDGASPVPRGGSWIAFDASPVVWAAAGLGGAALIGLAAFGLFRRTRASR